jgi:ATP-binding cassette subfamily B protein
MIVLRRLILFLKPETGPVLFAFLLLFITAGADLTRPFLLKIFIDDHLTPRQFESHSLLLLAGSWLLLLCITVAFNYWQVFTFKRIALRVIQQLRIDLFDHVQRLGLAYFDATPVGALVSRITNDTEAIKELYVNVLASFIRSAVSVSQ